MPTAQKLKPEKLTVDFTGVGERRGAAHIPPGDYIAKVKDYEIKYKKLEGGGFDKERPYINWQFVVTAPEAQKGTTLYFVTSLVKESLFNLRNLLEDMGVTVPQKAVDVPLGKLVGKEVGITVDDDEYEGKVRSKIQATFNKNSMAEVTEVDADEDGVAAAATTSEDDEDTEELDLDDL